MLADVLESILTRAPNLRIGVIGDLFLDRYLDIDARLTEPSIETGLDAYQVTAVRSYPGAAGTVINNLAALGVGRIVPVAIIGDDGEGYELCQALDRLGVVDPGYLFATPTRRTPTYAKPMLAAPGQPARELNRLDIKNRTPTPEVLQAHLVQALEEVQAQVDALLILDQVSEEECGCITARLRQALADLGARRPSFLMLADSRARIGLFRNVYLKPNETEARAAVPSAGENLNAVLYSLARQTGRPILCTCGARGIAVADPSQPGPEVPLVPAYAVTGPIDVVGAGDSVSAGIACALAAGAPLLAAAAFGNLVASITIQQLGTTGTATPAQLRARFAALSSSSSPPSPRSISSPSPPCGRGQSEG